MPVTRGSSAGTKPGTIRVFAYEDTDPAWVDCDGRSLTVSSEPALFAAIGYTWGGAGASFNVPALADDFIRASGPGRPVGTREADALKAHSHDVKVGTSEGDASNTTTNGTNSTTSLSTELTGSTETRPRNVAAKHRIKR